MTTNHIKAILTSLRAMVVKMLPAYKFYLGSTTETTTTQIGHGVMSVKDGQTQGQGALTLDDASFSGFVEGETYTAVINGLSGEYVAVQSGDGVLIINVQDFENPPEDYWAASFVSPETGEPYILMYSVFGSYANATISISQTKAVTTKKYQTKKLDKSLLPDEVESGIEAANTKAATALSAAQAAQDTANEAISSANTAQSTANTAKSTADAAQTTADAAQSTANTAQTTANTAKSTADAALPKSGGEVSGVINFPRNYSDGFSVGLRITSYISSKVLNNILKSAGVNQSVDKQIESVVTRMDGITIYSPNKISNFKTVTISAEGKRLDFSDYINKPITIGAKDIILSSSTANSTKKFRITVDDDGTLSATEVTDA